MPGSCCSPWVLARCPVSGDVVATLSNGLPNGRRKICVRVQNWGVTTLRQLEVNIEVQWWPRLFNLSFGGANLWCGNPTLQQYRHLASDLFGLQIGAEVTAPAQLSGDPFIACKTSHRGSYSWFKLFRSAWSNTAIYPQLLFWLWVILFHY